MYINYRSSMFRISDFRTDLCSLKLYEDGLSGFWMLNRAPATSAVDMLGVNTCFHPTRSRHSVVEVSSFRIHHISRSPIGTLFKCLEAVKPNYCNPETVLPNPYITPKP